MPHSGGGCTIKHAAVTSLTDCVDVFSFCIAAERLKSLSELQIASPHLHQWFAFPFGRPSSHRAPPQQGSPPSTVLQKLYAHYPQSCPKTAIAVPLHGVRYLRLLARPCYMCRAAKQLHLTCRPMDACIRKVLARYRQDSGPQNLISQATSLALSITSPPQ